MGKSSLLARGSFFSLVVLAGVNGCGGGDVNDPSKAPIICEDRRRALNCETEVAYQGVKAEGGFHVLDVAGANAAFTPTALRNINQSVEKYVSGQTRLCREYNSCIVTGSAYHAEAADARAHLGEVDQLVAKVNGSNARERANAADQLLGSVTGQTVTSLSISVALEAQLPTSAGGRTMVVAPNYPLPTNSRVAFNFKATQTAHVYLFQVDGKQKVSVLFPDDRIALRNPIPAGAVVRIPQGEQRYRLDDNGLGTERVYFAVSTHPLGALEQTLRRYASGQTQQLDQDSLLAQFGTLQPGRPSADCASRSRDLKLEDAAPSDPAGGCAITRGLVLDDTPPPSGEVTHSLEARAATGDDVIVKFFPFKHVREEEYKASLGEYSAPTAAGEHSRGISIEN